MKGTVHHPNAGDIRFREKFCLFKKWFVTKRTPLYNRVLSEDWFWMEWVTITEVFKEQKRRYYSDWLWVETSVVSGRHKKWLENEMAKTLDKSTTRD